MYKTMKINENIDRLTLPYKDIFTTVYLLKTPNGAVLFDAASTPEDVTAHITPFLTEAGVSADALKYVFISHNHTDHAGGLAQFVQDYPETTVVSCSATLKEKFGNGKFLCPEENTVLLDTFRVICIPGHTQDSCALLDLRTMTLITGDCLQLFGIIGSGDWAANVGYPTEHLAALEKVRQLQAAQIITAHDYYPLGYRADGAEEIGKMLDACTAPLRRLKRLIRQNPDLDDLQIRELYNETPGLPTIQARVVAAMRAAMEKDG